MKSCSFTGHRVINPKHKAKLHDLLARGIEYAYKEGCRTFYCGGALGFDTMAAQCVLHFRIKYRDIRLVILIPCTDQSDSWSLADKQMYDYILSSADEVAYTHDGVYTPNCMKIRNERLAELGDMLIAFSGRSTSGAAQTVRMAENMGKRVFNLYPTVVAE